MNKVKVLWSGITGRTGAQALEVVKDNSNVEIVAGICRSNPAYYNYEQLDEITEDFDVIVDFSHKDCFDQVLEFAIKMNKPIIIGTAQLSEEQVNSYEKAADKIPIFRGGNFRFDVKEFIDQVVEYAKTSGKKKLELIETHYKSKKIPSETAKVIAKRVLDEAGVEVEIKSFLEYDELINDWKVDHLHCHVVGFKKLAENVLDIAVMMKSKSPNGVYDLDRLFKEKELDMLKDFLIEAKKETYANANAKKVSSSRVGSSDYEYGNSGMTYHDTYFGGTNFMGEEVVYSSSQKPIWAMNYYGVTLDEKISEDAMDKALRPALMQVGIDETLPVRGPKEYINGDYKYEFKVVGDLTYFEGEETIRKNDILIYKLKCHGGLIKK